MTDVESSARRHVARSPLLSVVIPVRDEAENVEPLVAEIQAVLDGRVDYELVFVDDGSVDATPERLRAVARAVPALRAVRHRHALGQSAAIRSGAQAARGRLLATLDGDGQNDPADLLRLLGVWRRARAAGPLLVAGERTLRQAPWSRRLSSAIANRVRRRVLADGSRDSACGLKLCDRAAFLALPAFHHMHRFLPALFLQAGARVISVPVTDRPRRHGRSHYGIRDRLGVGLIDLLGVLWLKRRALPLAVDELSVEGTRPATTEAETGPGGLLNARPPAAWARLLAAHGPDRPRAAPVQPACRPATAEATSANPAERPLVRCVPRAPDP